MSKYKFGKKSLENLSSCDQKLVFLCNRVMSLQLFDFAVIEGHRGPERQNELFQTGFSKLQFPNSKHNQIPSRAIDVVPYPLDWNDLISFQRLITAFEVMAAIHEIPIVCGRDWKKFRDWPHIELVNE